MNYPFLLQAVCSACGHIARTTNDENRSDVIIVVCLQKDCLNRGRKARFLKPLRFDALERMEVQ